MKRLGRAFVLCHTTGCFGIAKGAAYSGLLALFPALTALAAVLVQIRARAVQRVLATFLSGILPPGTEDLVLDRFAAQGTRPTLLLIVAVALAVYAASGLMLSLMDGFNAVYKVKGRSFLGQRLMAALLVVLSAGPAVGASALILFGAQTERGVIRWMRDVPETVPLTEGILLAGQLIRLAIALGGVVLVTMFLYYLGPNRKQRWSAQWPGALVATTLWAALTSGFAWYVRNMAGYNVMYGSIAAVIALLVWMYLLSVAACFGCAFNAAALKARA